MAGRKTKLPIRDNKYARQHRERAQRNKRNNQAQDSPPTIDQQLARLEEDMRRLKVEFDIYFNGAAKRPPYDTKSRVEATVKRIADDRTLTFAQRYLYNSMVARYTAFREMWRRTMQGREEGRDAAAAARAAMRAAEQQTADPAIFICADGHRDVSTVKSLYEALVDAKRKCGEAVDDLSFPRFHHLIASRTDNLKEQLGCERVRFSVDIEGGRVQFKARAD
jgi:hypothetical protein